MWQSPGRQYDMERSTRRFPRSLSLPRNDSAVFVQYFFSETEPFLLDFQGGIVYNNMVI